MAQLSMKSLIEAGVHYGHLARKWNPRMKPFIFGIRNQVHIINLQHTIESAREAGQFVYDLGKTGKTILFVGTKKQAQDIVREEAARVGALYVTERWLGGTLTNFVSIRNIALKYKKIQEFLASEEGQRAPKKERTMLEKRMQSLSKFCTGILEMDRLPDAVFVIDIIRENIAITEAKAMGVPTIAIVDTNADPLDITYAVPGNDDALKSIRLFTSYIAESYREGRDIFLAEQRQNAVAQEGKAGTKPSKESKGKDEASTPTKMGNESAF